MLNQFSDWLKIILQIANMVIIGYGLYKFLQKPHDTLADEVKKLNEKVIAQELVLKAMNDSLNHSHQKHRDQEDVNAVFRECMLAFIDFEIAYCIHTGYEHNEDLLRAKHTLEKHLSGKKETHYEAD